ncbi:MAG: CoA transferase [Pseudomonadota bacterium]
MNETDKAMQAEDLILGDIRVLDVSEGVAGPFCTKLLAGLGAEVIKVEKPGTGDVSRQVGPFARDAPQAEQSATFLYLNTGKKSVTLDIGNQTGASLFQSLARECDILVESFPPGHMDHLGLGYRAIEPLNPGVIYTSITPFGQTGPYRDYKGSDLVAQAMGALMYTIGLPDREPLKVGGKASCYATGISAFSATMLALYMRDTEGHGQQVDVSAMETVTVSQIHTSISHQFGGNPGRKESTLVRARDGWVNPGLDRGIREDTWARVCELIGRPDLTDDPRFTTREARRKHQQVLLPIIEKWTASHSKEEIYHTFQGLQSVAGYVATVKDLFSAGQLSSRGFFQSIAHPYAGTAQYPGAPFTVQGTSWRHARAPLLGEHNVEIYCGRLGYTTEDLVRLRAVGVI